MAIKNLRLLISTLLLVIVVVVALIVRSHRNQSVTLLACGFRNEDTVSIGSHRLAAELASTPPQQNKGLSGRPCIGPNEAMLFIFNHPDQYSFWMKDMKFPIDMVWIGANHKVVVVQENVLPSTYPDSFVNPKSEPAEYVLELQAHATTKLNINPGTLVNF